MGLKTLISNLNQLKNHVETTLDANIQANLNEFADMERERLKDGIGNDGEPLEREGAGYYPYTPAYTKYKRSKGGRVDVVDLKLTGSYADQISASRTGKHKATLYSRDNKDRFLSEQYPKTHGFSPEQKQEVKQMFIPKLLEASKRKITSK